VDKVEAELQEVLDSAERERLGREWGETFKPVAAAAAGFRDYLDAEDFDKEERLHLLSVWLEQHFTAVYDRSGEQD
jgi:hypothetical protein